MLKDFFEEVVFPVVVGILVLFMLIAIPVWSCTAVCYFNNHAVEEVVLDGETIYTGTSRSIYWEQLGENGNLYHVKEYKKGFWNYLFGKLDNEWVGENLIVNNKEK